MNPTLKNALAVVAGLVLGSLANMAVIMLGPSIIPNPDGFDNSTMESMKETFHLLQPVHFVVPWIAHALGALVGGFAATKIAASHHFRLCMFIGIFFFIMGASMVFSIPSTPLWFSILDLVGAYVPMAWLGHKLAS